MEYSGFEVSKLKTIKDYKAMTKGECVIEICVCRFWFLLVCLLVLFGNVEARERGSEAELTTWWTTSGERKAMEVLERAFEARGKPLNVLYSTSQNEHSNYVKSRIENEVPPSMSQFFFGPEMIGMIQSGTIHSVALSDPEGLYANALHPALRELVGQSGNLWALPVGVHVHNSAFYNREIFKKLALSYPKSWDEFITLAPDIAAAGYQPIAVSGESAQLRHLFQAIVLDVGGVEGYLDLTKRIPRRQFKRVLEQAGEIFISIRKMVDYHGARHWVDIVRDLASDKAAMAILGDYAYSEFRVLGKVPGQDYDCALSPNSREVIVFGADTFVFFKNDDPIKLKAQSLMTDVVRDPRVQAAYMEEKGGLPTIKGIKVSDSNRCAQGKLAIWNDPNSTRVLSGSVYADDRSQAIDESLFEAWHHKHNVEWLISQIWPELR